MDYFQKDAHGVVCADGVPLPDIAAEYGTPTYVYSHATLMRHVQVLTQGLAALDARICYAVKANGNLALLRALGQQGCSFDAVSLGELKRVQAAGQNLAHTIFSGVGKMDHEIAWALAHDVLYLSVESEEELQAIATLAQQAGRVARVSIRVNPDVDAKTHPYISTGMAENKFGVPIGAMDALLRICRQSPHVHLVGLTCHIGSQITSLDPFKDAAHRLVALTRDVQQAGFALTHVGMGGGLGIPYNNEAPPNPAAYGAALAEILGPLKLQVVLEPGRVLVGNAGVLLTQVVRTKVHNGRTFVLIDAAMNDLLRPALYGAHHTLEVVHPHAGPLHPVDVVGPVCESADTFAKNLPMPKLAAGDLLILRSAGAYGSVMGSTYNGRPQAAEVLCADKSFHCIRTRQTHADLWRDEVL